MNKESFLIYKSFYEPIKFLDDEKLGKLFRAIFEYQINNVECQDMEIKMAFEFFKNQFRIDDEKYQKIVERNKENGKKGGRPKKNEISPKNPMGLKKPKKADNVNVNDNVNGNENDNDTTTNNIYEYVEKNFNRLLTPIEIDKISQWLSLYEEDIIKYAIELSVLNGKKTFNYVEGILKNWQGCNLNTLDEIKEYVESRSKDNKSHYKNSLERFREELERA